MTKRVLKLKGLHYREFRVDEDDTALRFVKEMGYLAAPVVVVSFDQYDGTNVHWSGFQPDKINALVD
mgnify:CR=1 FL=1